MYLSRLRLNPLHRAVQRDLADLQQVHRTIMRAFEQAKDTAQPRRDLGVLYRLELPASSGPQLLVQSAARPDWTFLPSGYLGAGVEPECKNLGQAYSALQAGQRFRFRLRANPTRKISVDDAGRPKGWRPARVELRGEENWIAWLEAKASRHGFRLLQTTASDGVPDILAAAPIRSSGCRGGIAENGRSRITVFSVLFEGRLEIVDAALFGEALSRGIGAAKAYGCGLLSIAGGR